ncbi:MAG: hypothetical protein HC914_18240 [Chloroflexaceae bacterium]|nr:hypothetical protein [Chloroflexaceae bacterium]
MRVVREGQYLTFMAVLARQAHYSLLEPVVDAMLDSYTLNTAVADEVVPRGIPPAPTVPPPAPVLLDELPAFPGATLLPNTDQRVRLVALSVEQQFGEAGSYQVYTIAPNTSFDDVWAFYTDALEGWADVTDLLGEAIQIEGENSAVWQRGEQLLLVSTTSDPLAQERLLVLVLFSGADG